MFKIECDFCSTTEDYEVGIPATWLSMRMEEKPREDLQDGELNTLIMGPTACPFHVRQIKLILSSY